MKWQIHRRTFLRGAAGPLLPLPFLNLMERTASGAASREAAGADGRARSAASCRSRVASASPPERKWEILRSVRAIEDSDVCLLMIDAQEGVQQQDLHILSLVQKNGKGLVVLVNKWDLIEKETNTMKAFEADVKKRIEPFTDVPVLFISVLEKQRILKTMELAMQVYEDRKRRIPTRKLNDVLLPIIERQPPPMYKAKQVTIKFITQLPTYVPSFVFYCNLPQYIKPSYERFLENRLREHWRFTGVHIRLFFRKK